VEEEDKTGERNSEESGFGKVQRGCMDGEMEQRWQTMEDVLGEELFCRVEFVYI